MFSRTERMVSSRWRYFRYNLLFLFYFNPEWSFQRIQVFLDANLPFGVALHIIFAPCCTEVIAVFLLVLQAALQAQGLTGGTIVLLVEELVVSVVDALREEYTKTCELFTSMLSVGSA